MKKIIINADDFGLCKGGNIGIAEGMEQGLISSTSIMACGEAFDHAVNLANERHIRNIGVHLVLDEERPLLERDRIPTVVDEKGNFLARGALLRKLLLSNHLNLSEVKSEYRAQIKKCIDAGIQPTHLDGHGHVHVYPKISKIIAELCTEFSIDKVRLPQENYSFVHLSKFKLGKYINKCIVTTFARLAKRHFDKAGLRYPAAFAGMLFGGNLNPQNFDKAISSIPRHIDVAEMMCHPGRRDPAQQSRYAHWFYNWNEELEAVLRQTKSDFENAHDATIISFAEL